MLELQVIYVTLNLGELHLAHALICEPVYEGLVVEHGQDLSRMLLNSTSECTVLLPMKVEAIFRPQDRMSHKFTLMLLGIHSTK